MNPKHLAILLVVPMAFLVYANGYAEEETIGDCEVLVCEQQSEVCYTAAVENSFAVLGEIIPKTVNLKKTHFRRLENDILEVTEIKSCYLEKRYRAGIHPLLQQKEAEDGM